MHHSVSAWAKPRTRSPRSASMHDAMTEQFWISCTRSRSSVATRRALHDALVRHLDRPTRSNSVTVHVSAIICTRNRPDLIGQAVASVLANTYPSFELVVVDQSDNDVTGGIVRSIAAHHPNVNYIYSSTPGLS